MVIVYATRCIIMKFFVLHTHTHTHTHRLFRLCFLCGFQKEQRSFPNITLPKQFCNRYDGCLPRGTNWAFEFNPV